MQYILQEEEYNKLVDRTKLDGALKNFVEGLVKFGKRNNPYVDEINLRISDYQQLLETLKKETKL